MKTKWRSNQKPKGRAVAFEKGTLLFFEFSFEKNTDSLNLMVALFFEKEKKSNCFFKRHQEKEIEAIPDAYLAIIIFYFRN
jgi:hypothetical protein